MRWSNDPTIDPTSENNGNVGRPHPTFFISVKFHPTSKVAMLGDPTWWSNDPTFHPTWCWVKCWVRCWIVWPELYIKYQVTDAIYFRMSLAQFVFNVYLILIVTRIDLELQKRWENETLSFFCQIIIFIIRKL